MLSTSVAAVNFVQMLTGVENGHAVVGPRPYALPQAEVVLSLKEKRETESLQELKRKQVFSIFPPR